MKNFFSIIIIFAVLLVGGGWVFMKQAKERTRKETADALAEARRGFAHKARAAAEEDDIESYRRGIRAAIEQYKDELKGRVYKDREELRDVEDYKKRVEERFKKGEFDEARRKSMLEGYDIVKQAYDALMTGAWQPVFSEKGKGGTRLDIYTLEKITDPEGRPILEGKFFFWGIEDSTVVSWGDLALRLWKTQMEKVKEGRQMVDKEVEVVLGKVEGESEPHIIIKDPSVYIAEFPSFVSVGYLWLPVAPYDAKFMDLEYAYRTKNYGGGEVESRLKWEKVPLESRWKLREDQQWDADEIEATEEEIRGIDPAEQQAQEGTAPQEE